ncbi:UNVERIFIED_CONTAM: hypothetical protein GTU68_018453 [Idotea baltica]|nr:hypothetical protein [Idotea baltica]
MGNAVGWFDRRLNQGSTPRLYGILTVALLCLGAGALGGVVSYLPFSPLFEVLFVAALLAQRSLVDHVNDVSQALRLSVSDGRMSVARIVGRDTRALDESGIARSAIESAAENLSDGVVAPAFWFLVAGLPGLLIYKIINTADSMIGYRTPKYEAFGWAAARLDDVLNWAPARLTAFLMIAAAGRFDVIHVLRRDARLHRSPNAGWPEAAMAGILGIALSGPRSYEGHMRDFAYVHPEGRRSLSARDIDAAVKVLWRSWALGLIVIFIAALL